MLRSASLLTCLPVLISLVTALCCHTLSPLFAEAPVSQRLSVVVCSAAGHAIHLGEGLKGCCNAIVSVLTHIYNFQTLVSPAVTCSSPAPPRSQVYGVLRVGFVPVPLEEQSLLELCRINEIGR